MNSFYVTFTYLLAIFTLPHDINCINFNITSPPVTDWGTWGRFEECPAGTNVQGFQLKTEKYQGPFVDDTAVNGVRLFCGNPFEINTQKLESSVGEYGTWGNVYSCFPGSLNGFQLRVEPNLGAGDDTATNNMRVYCSVGDPNQFIEGDGLAFGVWGETRRCYSDQAVCGLQTQVEDCSKVADCSSLNNVLMECCDQ